MAVEVTVPVQGNDADSAVLAELHVAVGDVVTAGQPVFTIETAKAAFEVTAPGAGTVLAVRADLGAELAAHSTVLVLGAAGEQVSEPAVALESDPDSPALTRPASTRRSPASPRARVLAARHGIEVAGLRGTGPHGRVIARDVVAARDHPPSAASAGAQPVPSVVEQGSARATPARVVPVTGIRKIVAERMVTAQNEAAPYTLFDAVDARPLIALRSRFNGSDPRWGVSGVSVTDLVAFAAVRVLAHHPRLNAHFAWSGITEFEGVDLGLAVQTPRGLVVGVLPAASDRGLADLSGGLRQLAIGGRAGTLAADELTGSTFTVSSLGARGPRHFSPVLNLPEVAILGVGALGPAAVASASDVAAFSGELAPAIHLSLTVDHRAVDGVPAADYLHDLGIALREIESLIGS